LKKEFSQKKEPLLQQKAIKRERWVKGKHKHKHRHKDKHKHKQEKQKQKQKEMTHGEDCLARGKGNRRSSHWWKHRPDSNGGNDSEHRADKADEGEISVRIKSTVIPNGLEMLEVKPAKPRI
jgi:hypothetical protein